jgi:hypothetical protein
MKAIVQDVYGSADVLRLDDIDVPEPAPVRCWCACAPRGSIVGCGT